MNGRLHEIRLSGVLAKRYGRLHFAHLDSKCVTESISYLRANFPGIDRFLLESKGRGMGFAIFANKRNLTEEQLRTERIAPGECIRIVPVLLGSKRSGLFNVILGAALIAVSFALTGPIGAALLTSRIGMAAGGRVQMLSPQPKGLKAADSPENQPSYIFNGSVNTQAQGNPVPLLYGRMIVGSAVISAGINAEDYAPATSGVDTGTPLDSFKKNFYDEAGAPIVVRSVAGIDQHQLLGAGHGNAPGCGHVAVAHPATRWQRPRPLRGPRSAQCLNPPPYASPCAGTTSGPALDTPASGTPGARPRR